jgi:hypothetical protein
MMTNIHAPLHCQISLFSIVSSSLSSRYTVSSHIASSYSSKSPSIAIFFFT